MKNLIYYIIGILFLSSCNNGEPLPDAYGNFESDETTISALMPGKLVYLNLEEGQKLDSGYIVGVVDTTDLHLTKAEIAANRKAIGSQGDNVFAQLKVLDDQLANLEREQKRLQNLIEAGVATTQQLDDINGKIDVVHSQKRSVRTQNSGVIGQLEALDAKLAQLNYNIQKSLIINPVNGVVLSKLTEAFEMTGPGKPVYKIADLDELYLRAFITGTQLTSVKIREEVTVKVDGKDGNLLEFPGTVSWISDEAEFTPKNIQTREERVDLVYAVKIRVKNDGSLKLGMPGELWFNSNKEKEMSREK